MLVSLGTGFISFYIREKYTECSFLKKIHLFNENEICSIWCYLLDLYIRLGMPS